MEHKNVRNVIDSLQKYDYLSNNESDYISVTEWSNGEGYDIDLNGKQSIRLTSGELDAINYLVKTIEYGDKEDSK